MTGPLFNLGRTLLSVVGVVGAAVIAWKVFTAVQRCCQSKPIDGEGHASHAMFTVPSPPDTVKNRARSRLPTLPLTLDSGDERVNAAVQVAFDR